MPSTSLDDIVAQAITDAVTRFGTDDADIVVLAARDVTWRDSGLGCPAPGVSHLQRLTEGFLVVLRIGSRRVEYHSGGATLAVLMDQFAVPSTSARATRASSSAG